MNHWETDLIAITGTTIRNYLPEGYENIREDYAQEIALEASVIIAELIHQPERNEEIEQEIYELWEYDEDYI